MNIVIAAEKKYNKLFTNCLAFGRHNLIGYETEMKPNFVKRIAEHYNPHILVVLRGVRSKKFDFFSSLDMLLKFRPNLRIIYLFGKVNEKNEDEYFKTVELFKSYNIYDVIPFDPYERGFSSKFADLLKTPLTEEKLQGIMETFKPDDNGVDIFNSQKFEKIVDETPVKITKAEIENPNYSSKVITVDEAPERLDEDMSEHITIAVGTISDRQAGCTLTSFELAVTLGQLKQTAAVFLDEETYNNYVSYHGLSPSEAREGCEINGITIYPP